MSGPTLRASGVLLLLIAAVIALTAADAPNRKAAVTLIGIFAALGALSLGFGIRKRPNAVPGRVHEGWSRRNAVIGAIGAVLAPITLLVVVTFEWPMPKIVLLFGLLGAPLSMLLLVSYELSCVRCRRALEIATPSEGQRVWYCGRCRGVAISENQGARRVHVDAAATQVVQGLLGQRGRARP